MISVIAILMVVSIGISPVLAHPSESYHEESYFLESDLFFKIQTFIEDVRITLASTDDKVILIKEFVSNKQTTINNAVINNESTSLDIEDRRMTLVDMLSDFTAESGKYQSDMWDISEMNEIRLLYSQFEDCSSSCSSDEKLQFNDSVNQLNSWNNHCTESFNIDHYSYDMESYDKLSNVCPELKSISIDKLRNMV